MRRFVTLAALAMLGYALLPSFAQAQVIVVPSRPAIVYSQPVIVGQPVYAAPTITTYSSPATYSYYPSTIVSSSPGVVTYSAPVAGTVVVPAAGVITTRSYYGYGIFRPRGYYTESYYTPLR